MLSSATKSLRYPLYCFEFLGSPFLVIAYIFEIQKTRFANIIFLEFDYSPFLVTAYVLEMQKSTFANILCLEFDYS